MIFRLLLLSQLHKSKTIRVCYSSQAAKYDRSLFLFLHSAFFILHFLLHPPASAILVRCLTAGSD
ncbi:MAG: hypothetical protein L6437_01585, partial [Kiritimatiellae bacterium]|nr:hypothetical protein [Kiritimatiellia bacterium]